jgi:hypothetical protein
MMTTTTKKKPMTPTREVSRTCAGGRTKKHQEAVHDGNPLNGECTVPASQRGETPKNTTVEEAKQMGDSHLAESAIDEHGRHRHGYATGELHRRLCKEINHKHAHHFHWHHGIDSFGGRLYVYGNDGFTGVGGRVFTDLYPLLKKRGIEVIGFALSKNGYSWIALTDLTDDAQNIEKMDRLQMKAFMKPFKGK